MSCPQCGYCGPGAQRNNSERSETARPEGARVMPTKQQADRIAKCRDALVQQDYQEAWHQLYWLASDMSDNPFEPWKTIDALSTPQERSSK